MAYKFDPVINTYVDPKSVEISKTLNERFAQNFAVSDALDTALRDMQFAPFENDSALAKQTREEADARLKQIAERGDYENMTFPLHTLAKETGNRLKPLADNYTRYANTLTELNKRLEKADINAEQFQLYKGYMTRGYKGIQLDENGRVKQGSEFMPPTLYNDPKVMDRITKRLEILHTQKTGSETTGIQRDPNTGDLLSITQGGTLTKIDPELVQQAVDAVMQESDVKMYFDQMGTMKATALSDALGGPDKLVAAQVTNLQDKIGQLNNELNSGKYGASDKKKITNSINALNTELNNLSKLSTPDEMLNYAKQSIIKDYQSPIREYANLKGGIYEKTSVYKVDNITAKAKETEAIKWAAEHPELLSSTEVVATAFGGKNIQEKVDRIGENQKEIYRLQKVVETGIENGTKLDDTEIKKAQQQIIALQNDQKLVEGQIKEAARKSISYEKLKEADPTIVEAMSEWYDTKDPGELYLKMQQVFDNVGDQDFMDFKNYFNGKYKDDRAWDKYLLNTGKGSIEGEPDDAKEYRKSLIGQAQSYDNNNIPSFNTTGELNTYFKDKFEKYIDKGLLEVKTSPTFLVNQAPGLTITDRRAFTAAFDNLFKGKPLLGSVVYTDAAGNDIGSKDGYTIVSYGTPVYGTDLIQFNATKGTNKTPITIYADRHQFNAPELEAVYNSNSFKLGSRIMQAGNLNKYDVIVKSINPQTNQYGPSFTLKFSDAKGNGKPLVTVIGADGKLYDFTKLGLPAVKGAIDPNSELFKNFIERDIFEVN